MEKVNEIKIPKGVESISVKQYENKIVIEFIPEEPKKGDFAIFWDKDKRLALIKLYDKKDRGYHYDSFGVNWENAIKFKSKEQYEKVLRGEI